MKSALPPVKMLAGGIDGRRGEIRFATDPTAVKVRLGGRENPITALLVEVSKSGFRLTLNEQVSFGVLICIEMPGFALLGDARHCQPLPGNKSYSVGVKLRGIAGQ